MIQFGIALSLDSRTSRYAFSCTTSTSWPLNDPKPTRRMIMTRIHAIRICGLAVFAALTASVTWANTPRSPGDDAAESPALKAIQGTWVSSDNSNLEAKWVFKGDKLSATV